MYEFSHLIEDDEKIIHVIKPRKAPYMAFAWVTTLIVILFAVVLIVALSFMIGEFEDMSLIIYAALGSIVLGCGSGFIVLELRYRSYLYCITNKKVIIRSGIIGRDFRVLELESITTVDMNVGFSDKICGGTTGTIQFFNSSNATYHASGMETGYNKNGFQHIENVHEIYKEIKNLIAQSKGK